MEINLSQGSGVSVEEAAHLLGISTNTVRRRIKQGSLQAERVSRPQGYVYRVYLPEVTDSKGRGEAIYRELMNILHRQLCEKDKQIASLLNLLHQERQKFSSETS
jgi:excisionase family DNA binding protein